VNSLDWVTLASLILAVLALLLAGFHLSQGRGHRTTLEFVARSLSTRYVDEFPHYLEKVTEVVSSTRASVRIITATPAPAFFTNSSAYLNYRQTLERLVQEGKRVQIVCMPADRRRERLVFQFTEDDWCSGKYVSQWMAFAPRYPDCQPQDTLPDYSTFISFLVCAQTEEFRRLEREGIKMRVTGTLLTMNAWIADEAQAVVAFQVSSSELSHGIYTSDPKLIGALIGMSELLGL